MAIFPATQTYVGDPCYICKRPIALNDRIIFLGGSDIAHIDCMHEEI